MGYAFDAACFVADCLPRVTTSLETILRMQGLECDEVSIMRDGVRGAEEARIDGDDDAAILSLPHHYTASMLVRSTLTVRRFCGMCFSSISANPEGHVST